jgi:hypothetical protein
MRDVSRLRAAAVGRMLAAPVPKPPPPTRQPPDAQNVGDRLARLAVVALLAGVAWGTIAGAITLARAIGAWLAR